MNRTDKEQELEELRAGFNSAASLVFGCHQGIPVNVINNLRADFRKAGVQYKVIKNSLAKIAVRDTPMAGLAEFFVGPVAVAYSTEDPVVAAKILHDFAKKKDKYKLLAGYLDGQSFGPKGVQNLAAIPSKDELRAQFLSLLNATSVKFLLTLKAYEEHQTEGQAA
jgi:large subunit ribosomal protein L10